MATVEAPGLINIPCADSAELYPQVAFIATTRKDDEAFNKNLVGLIRELGYECLVIAYPEIKQRADEIRQCKIAFVGGVPAENDKTKETYSADYAETVSKELEPLMVIEEKEEDFTIVGVCAGHQAIAHYFGAKIKRVDMDNDIPQDQAEIEHGITELCVDETFEHHEILDGLDIPIRVWNSHWAWIDISKAIQIQRIAKSLSKLNVSTGCLNSLISIKDREIFCFQFHPEDSGLTGKRMIYNLMKMSGLDPNLDIKTEAKIESSTAIT